MTVSADILATYRAPRRVMARLLRGERHEARALAYLLAALVLMLIAQVPALRATAAANPETPFAASLLARALALGVMLPVFYLVAGLSRLGARVLAIDVDPEAVVLRGPRVQTHPVAQAQAGHAVRRHREPG